MDTKDFITILSQIMIKESILPNNGTYLGPINHAPIPWADDVNAQLMQRVTLNQTQVGTVRPQPDFSCKPIPAISLDLIWSVP